MSDTALPSWRVRPRTRTRAGWGIPPFGWLLIAGLVALSALFGVLLWGQGAMDPREAPLIRAADAPFRVPPPAQASDTPSAPDLIFERGSAARERLGDERLVAAPEAPMPPDWLQPQPAEAPESPAAALPAPVAPPAAPPTAAAPPASGPVQVQLGALTSEEAAQREWDRLRRAVAELSGRTPTILPFEREGRPTFWRLRVGGLPDRDSAHSLCDQVRARGGNCAVLGG